MPVDVKTQIVEYFSSTLRVPRHQIDTGIHILELGIDSITLVEAQRWLKAEFGCLIEVHRFFEELNTIDRIAAFVGSSQLTVEPKRGAGAPTKPPLLPVEVRQAALSASRGGSLMRSQLALVGEIIEAQNRLLATAGSAGAKSDDASVS